MQFSESKFDKMTTQYNGKWNFRTVWGLLYTVYFEIIEDVNNSVLGFVSFAGKELKLWLSGTGEFWKFTSINVQYTFVKRRLCYHYGISTIAVYFVVWCPGNCDEGQVGLYCYLFTGFQSYFRVPSCKIVSSDSWHVCIISLTVWQSVKFCRRVCWHTVFKDKM